MTSRPAPSARQVSRKAADAADRLLDWLKQQDGLPHGSGGGQAGSGPPAGGNAEAPSPDPPALPIPAKCEASAWEDASRGLDESLEQEREVGRSLARRVGHNDDASRAAPALRPAHTEWLHHRLLVAGPAGTLAGFQAAACGSGTLPWQLDLDHMEEDLFLLLAAPPLPQRRRLSLAGARALAGQLRDAAEQRHAAAVARVGQSRACAFDLHALVPVPPGVLQRGPDHPEALAWLWTIGAPWPRCATSRPSPSCRGVRHPTIP